MPICHFLNAVERQYLRVEVPEAAVFMMETLRAFVSGFMDRCARNAMHKVI